MINSYIKELDSDIYNKFLQLQKEYEKDTRRKIIFKEDDIILLSLRSSCFLFTSLINHNFKHLPSNDDAVLGFIIGQRFGEEYKITHCHIKKEYAKTYRWLDGREATLEEMLRQELKGYVKHIREKFEGEEADVK